MSETQEKTSKPTDPLDPFRAMRDAYLDAMAKSMVEAVNTEAYAQATGAMLDGYLSASAPMREALDKSMVQALQQLSLPSRQEVAALAERFTNLELCLDDMDAKLDAIQKILRSAAHPPEPPAGKDARPDVAIDAAHPRGAPPVASARRPAVRRRIARRNTPR
ncbi:MAG: poly(R)-hydroxyalkanoic acid synthase subunit PhaE [Acidobacteriaceae bacterium]